MRAAAGVRGRPVVATLTVLTVTVAGCGSRVDERRFQRAAERRSSVQQPNGPATTSTPGPDTSGPDTTAAIAGVPASRHPAPTADRRATPETAPASRTGSSAGTAGSGSRPSALAGLRPSEAPPGGSSTPPPGAPGGQATASGDLPAAPPGAARASGPRSRVVIGSFGTSSGPIGAVFAPVQVATRAWVADVNARGGLGGHPVTVLYADDGGDGARALAIARRMVEQDKVLFFLNLYQVTTIEAVIPYLEEKRIPVVQGGGASPAEDHSEMIFKPTQGGDAGWVLASIESLKAQSSERRIAILYCRETNACPNGVRRLKERRAALGIDIVYEAQVSIAQPDYTAEVLQARNAGAEVLFAILDAASGIRAVRSARRQNWNPLFLTTGASNDDVTTGASDLKGLLSVTQGTPPYMEGPWLADYRETVKKRVPEGALGGTGASAWVAAKLVEKIAPQWGDQPTTAAVIESLYSLEGETLGGLLPPITFPRSGERVAINLCGVPLYFDGRIMKAPFGHNLLCGAL